MSGFWASNVNINRKYTIAPAVASSGFFPRRFKLLLGQCIFWDSASFGTVHLWPVSPGSAKLLYNVQIMQFVLSRNLNLWMKTEPITTGAEATVYAQHLSTYIWPRNIFSHCDRLNFYVKFQIIF